MDEEICKICGKEKHSSKKGSLTQFISVCTCNVKRPETKEHIIQLCKGCGKRIGSGRKGSMTQYVFRADICECETPKPFNKTVQVTYESAAFLDEDDKDLLDEDLQIDEDNFPLDRYKPLKKLGSGSGGSVYLARDTLLNKLVAVKTLHVLEKEQLISFQEEARATSKLRHPNVIQILDFGATEHGTPYMVLEYFKGTTLKSLIEERGYLKSDLVIEIATDLAKALSYSHGQGVLHRDIKPSNILIKDIEKSEIQVKLIDFGVARVSELTGDTTEFQGKTLAGTPNYMSPDVSKGFEYSDKSEIYSLGCVMFEALTGRVPFKADTALETLSKHANMPPPSMSEVSDNNISKEIENFVAVCLEKDPGERYENMDEFIKAVERLSPQKTFSKQEKPDKKTSPSKIILGVVLIAIAAIVGAISFNRISPSKQVSKTKIKIKRTQPIRYIKTKETASGAYGPWMQPYKPDGSIEDEDLKTIADDVRKNSYENLDLSDTTLTGSGFKYLKNLPIKSLALEGVDFEQKYFKDLALPLLVSISLKNINITGEIIDHLKNFKMLSIISLEGCKSVSDDDICLLAKNNKIAKICLSDTNITDKSLECLSKTPVTKVSILDTKITDKGIAALAGAPYINNLNIANCFDVTVGGVKHFCDRNKNLSNLNIAYIKYDGTPLSFVKEQGQLHHLNVMGLPITDNDLKAISKAKKINSLNIENGNCTDKGLAYLHGINFKDFSIHNCRKVTPEGVKKLQDSLPRRCSFMTDIGAFSRFGRSDTGDFKTLYKDSD